MKTKTTVITFIFIAFLSLSLNAQRQNNQNHPHFNDEKIKAEKVAFITLKLDLSVEEAQLFWPVYNEFDGKMDKLFKEEHKLYRESKRDRDILTDTELTTKLDRMMELREEKCQLESEYHKKYKAILPIKKLALYYESDKEFRKQLLKKYKGHGSGAMHE